MRRGADRGEPMPQIMEFFVAFSLCETLGSRSWCVNATDHGVFRGGDYDLRVIVEQIVASCH